MTTEKTRPSMAARAIASIHWPAAAVAIAFIVAGAVVYVETPAEEKSTILAGVAALWAVVQAFLPSVRKGGGGAALLLLCLAPAVAGCGATALETQATGVTVALRIVDAAQDVYAEDLDHRMAGCTDDACITEARAHGQPVEAALDTALVAVRAWGAAIAVAADVDAGGDVPAVVLSALARVLSLWDELEAALRAYGVAVPPEVGHAIAFLAALAGAT